MTNVTDTLAIDTAGLNAWRADDNFDYGRELAHQDTNIIEWILERIDQAVSSLFDDGFYIRYHTAIWVTIGIVAVLSIVIFLLYKHPELFDRKGSTHLAYKTEEDTIYGVDFATAISHALSLGDYREAVRMIYLQTLKTLSDSGKINWQPYKTPTQYTYEVRSTDFRTFTNHFLRVRYGNFSATADLCDEMKRLQTEIEKGGME